MKPVQLFQRSLAVTILLAATMAHGEGCGCGGGGFELGPPTGAECPPDSTLTYEGFAVPFFAAYCNDCHSSELHGEDRMGAPSFHDFDTQLGIQQVAEHIDAASGSGPDATNTGMPEEAPFPTLVERQQLAEWIACGAP
jgi:hypothetical protein